MFPATYELRRGARALDAGAEAGGRVRARTFGSVDLSYARRKNLTPYDVLKIASMVEREAQLDKERPLVAAVIYNRLKQGMPLGIDATIRYAPATGPSRSRRASSAATRRTTRAPAPGCRRRRSATRASPRCVRPRGRRTSITSITW